MGTSCEDAPHRRQWGRSAMHSLHGLTSQPQLSAIASPNLGSSPRVWTRGHSKNVAPSRVPLHGSGRCILAAPRTAHVRHQGVESAHRAAVPKQPRRPPDAESQSVCGAHRLADVELLGREAVERRGLGGGAGCRAAGVAQDKLKSAMRQITRACKQEVGQSHHLSAAYE